MAHSKQARKRVRQNLKRKMHNRAQKTRIKTFKKRFLKAVEDGDKKTAADAYVEVQALIDKAAKTRLVHPNKASRDKAKLVQKLNSIG